MRISPSSTHSMRNTRPSGMILATHRTSHSAQTACRAPPRSPHSFPAQSFLLHPSTWPHLLRSERICMHRSLAAPK
ncbi:hypothetical protein BDV11DRAFT_189731 [Aspergillus similis]